MTITCKVKSDATVGVKVLDFKDDDKLNCSDYDDVAISLVTTPATVTVIKAPLKTATVSLATPVKYQKLPSATTIDTAYEVSTVWYEGASVAGSYVTSPAKAKTQYTAQITLTPKTGESFADSVTVSGDVFEGTEEPNNAGNLVFTKTFPATADKAVTGIAVDDGLTITRPTQGQDPATTTLTAKLVYEDGSKVTATDVTWSLVGNPANIKIVDGDKLQITYLATATPITVKAVSGDYNDTGTVTVDAAAATPTSISLTGGTSSVTVTPGENVTTTAPTATVYDQYGSKMVGKSVTWSIPATTPASISVDPATGVLTVTPEAQTQDVVLRATVPGTDITNAKTISVTRPAPVATIMTDITDYYAQYDVPKVDQNNKTRSTETNAPSVTVKDQFGLPMPEAEVTWSILTETTPTGVTIDPDTGKLTIKSTAKDGQLTVKATCGALSKTDVITLKRETATPTSIEVTGGNDVIIIPKTGTNPVGYNATVYNQYGEAMDRTVTWSLSKETTGVSIDANGTVSVTPSAGEDDFQVVATFGSVSGKKNVELINKEEVTVTLASKTDAEYNGKSIKLTPAYVDMPGIGELKETVTYKNDTSGVVTNVAPTDAGTYTVTATYENSGHYGTATAQLVIKPKPLTITGVSAENRNYDGTTDVTLKGGKLQGNLDGAKVSFDLGKGTIAEPDASNTSKDVQTNIQLTGEKASNYVLTQPTTVRVTITKRPLTVTYDGDPITKVYDGNTDYTDNIPLKPEGLADADKAGTLAAKGGTFNYKDVKKATTLTLGNLEATGFDTDNYSYTLPKPAASITAKPVMVTITCPSSPQDYTPAGPVITGAYTPVTGDTMSAVTVTKTGTNGWPNVGTYTLDATIADTNYSVELVTVKSFTINKATPAIDMALTQEVRFNDTATKTVTPATLNAKVTGGLEYTGNGGDDIIGTWPAFGAAPGNAVYALRSGLTVANVGQTHLLAFNFVPTDSNNYKSIETIVTVKVVDKSAFTGTLNVKQAGTTYGTPLSAPTTTASVKGGTWTFSYQGVGDTTYGPSADRPTLPGTYTVTATYDTETQRGSTSANFTIAQKPLTITGLSVDDKTYNGTTDAVVTGTIQLSGAEVGDEVNVGSLAKGSASFADMKVGTGKAVTVAITGTAIGANIDRYIVPTTVTIKGNIVAPPAPVVYQPADDEIGVGSNIVLDNIPEVASDTDALKAALKNKTTGNKIEYRQVTVTGGTGTVRVLMPYPSGAKGAKFTASYATAAGVQTATVEKDPNGQGVLVTLPANSDVALALAWRKSSSSSGSSSSSEITVVTEPITTAKAAEFRLSSGVSNIASVKVDGVNTKALSKGTNYTIKSDTNAVILTAAYMKTLAKGDHWLYVTYNSGVTVSTRFTVGVSSAQTGDMGVAMYGVMALISASGAVWVTRRKKEDDAR